MKLELFHTFIIIYSSFTGRYILDSQYDQLPVGLHDSLVGKALHRHRRGHGFDSRSSQNFFRGCGISTLEFTILPLQHCLYIYLAGKHPTRPRHVAVLIRTNWIYKNGFSNHSASRPPRNFGASCRQILT